jgi:nucleoside-diphosphate-sugar epimerase
MIVAVVGGSGFVGTRLVKRLLLSGHTVRIADKRPSRDFPDLWFRCDVRNDVDGLNEYPDAHLNEVHPSDIADQSTCFGKMRSLREVLSGCDVVINLAAEHRDDVSPRTLYDEVNVDGALHVCDACTKLGIHNVIFTSSVAVYGFAPMGTDESGVINYFNDYGRTKWLAEGKYREWLCNDPMNSLTIIRSTVIFGEGNRGNVYNLLKQIAGGRFPMVGNGKNKKSMNYVENVAAFIEHNLQNGPGEHLFNYCDTPVYDMNTLVSDVHKYLGKPKKMIFHWPYFLGYYGGICFDCLAFITRKKLPVSSIRVKKFCQNTFFTSSNLAGTGFTPPVRLDDGIQKTVEYEFVKKTQGHTFVCE